MRQQGVSLAPTHRNTFGGIAVRERRRDARDALHTAESRGFNHHTRESRVRGHARHSATDGGESFVVERAEGAQGRRRFIDAQCVGRIKPRKRREISDTQRHRLEHRTRKINARDFGQRVRVAPLVFRDTPQSNGASWRRAPCATCALLGAGAGHRLDSLRVEAAQRVVAMNARES